MTRVMMVGSAERSSGGVASAIRSMKSMPFWKMHDCYWLGTQIQGSKLEKLRQAIGSYIIASFKIWRYDVIHFHTVADLICLVVQLPVFLLAVLGHKKIIMHIHMGNQIGDHTKDRLFNWCLKKSDCIIVLSEMWKRKFNMEWFTNLHVPVHVIYNACPVNGNNKYEGREKMILFAGYMDKNKAYDLMLRAYSKVEKKHPDWSLMMLGNGDVQSAENYARHLGLDTSSSEDWERKRIRKKVTFTGYVVGQEKAKIFESASICCLCSYQEGFPVVVLEAWGYGIPVVTTPVGGLPDVIVEGKNAVTFPFGDSEKLAETICKLIENYELRTEMSKFSKSYVHKHFSPSVINDTIETIYSSL